jgi:hypothetical protein
MPKYILRVIATADTEDEAFEEVLAALELLNMETAIDSFGPAPEDHWADHEQFEDWVIAVKDGDTRLGFWEWLNTQKNNETEEEEEQDGK